MTKQKSLKATGLYAPVRVSDDGRQWIDYDKVSCLFEVVRELLLKEEEKLPGYYEANPVDHIARIEIAVVKA